MLGFTRSTLSLVALLSLVSCHSEGHGFGTTPEEIRKSFNYGTDSCDIETLHHCSEWKYLSNEAWDEMVLDSVSKLDPPIKNGDRIFDMGVGVGAPFKTISKHWSGCEFGGSDFADKAIAIAQQVFPQSAKHFIVQDMTLKHVSVPDGYYDHVMSFGALAMYLTRPKMLDAMKEALRMTKPGGSILVTSFIEPGGSNVGSIVTPIEKTFWAEQLPGLGGENIHIHPMKHQGDRYQLTFSKKK